MVGWIFAHYAGATSSSAVCQARSRLPKIARAELPPPEVRIGRENLGGPGDSDSTFHPHQHPLDGAAGGS